MGLIKDIIDANSIEQKRRLANRLPIDMEDKNSLINNKGNAGEGEGSSDYMWYISEEEHTKIESSGLREMLHYARVVCKYISTDDNIEIIAYGHTGAPKVKQEIAYGILMTMPIQATVINSDVIVHTFKEYLEYLGYDLSGVKWMTKEQFYNLEA